VELHPELADALQNDCRQELAALEREFDIQIQIVAASGLHRAEERIEWRPRTKQEDKVLTAAVSAADLADGVGGQPKHKAAAEDRETVVKEGPLKTVEDGDKPKPRRRRRGGRRRKKTAAIENGADANGAEPPDEPEAAPPAGEDDAPAPAKKSRRRRPRRSRKKAAHPSQSEDAAPEDSRAVEPAPFDPQSTDPDPFAY